MRIFDCFTFFNEIDLLKIRLSLLNEVVDYFVIVEMNKTFTGINKNFNLEANKAFFDEYREKIIYLKIKDIPNFKGIDDVEWEREYFQRNCIMRGIVNCEPSDIIIISDVDEIPNPEVLKNILKSKIHWFGQNNIRWIDRIRNIIYIMMLYAENKRISNILDIFPVVLEQDIYSLIKIFKKYIEKNKCLFDEKIKEKKILVFNNLLGECYENNKYIKKY